MRTAYYSLRRAIRLFWLYRMLNHQRAVYEQADHLLSFNIRKYTGEKDEASRRFEVIADEIRSLTRRQQGAA